MSLVTRLDQLMSGDMVPYSTKGTSELDSLLNVEVVEWRGQEEVGVYGFDLIRGAHVYVTGHCGNRIEVWQ